MLSKLQDTEDIGCIVGAVVQLKTDDIHAVCQCLLACNGVEIHAQDERARLVITMEAKKSKDVLTMTESIQNIQGVLSITPVYQYSEENSSQNEKNEHRGWQWR